jgi:hypothetical protein
MRNLALRYVYPLLPVILLIFNVACTPQACQEETEANVKATFYKTGSPASLAPDSITLFGLGRDTSLIYDNARNMKNISIPLDAGSDTCRFVMIINDCYDTVTFVYVSYAHLVSKECGFTFYHILDTILNKQDTINYYIIKRDITTLNEENISIFY